MYSKHAANYGEAVRRGDYGLAVHVSQAAQMARAEDFMNAAGAANIDPRSKEWRVN